MSIVVVIVSGCSAWLVLGPDEYLINVQSEAAVALIQFKLCFNLKLVTAITRGPKICPRRESNRGNLDRRSTKDPLDHTTLYHN